MYTILDINIGVQKIMKCQKCKQEKEECSFSKNKSKKSGFNKICKDCFKKYKDSHYENNKEYYIEKNKRNKLKIKEFIQEYKEKSSCKLCGENHIATLDFHHKDPLVKDFSLSNYNWGIERVKKEIEKCEILCSNCHRKLHYQIRNTAY